MLIFFLLRQYKNIAFITCHELTELKAKCVLKILKCNDYKISIGKRKQNVVWLTIHLIASMSKELALESE